MPKVILVTGGSRSGKSEFSENLLKNKDNVLYIATAIPTDIEMEHRIKKHKERRNPKWENYEGYKNLNKVILNYNQKNILLDCVTVMVTNLMFDKKRDFDNMKNKDINSLLIDIKTQFQNFILSSRKANKNLILVTNEVGYGLVPSYKLGRIFRDIAGSVNQLIASLSDEVYIVTCGLPLKLK